MNPSRTPHRKNLVDEIDNPLALIVWVQPGYDEDALLSLIKSQAGHLHYKQIILFQQTTRDISPKFLQAVLKEKLCKRFELWDGSEKEFSFKEALVKLSKKVKIHLLLLTVPETLQEIEMFYRYEKYYQDFPEEAPLSLMERKSLYQSSYKEMLSTITLINSVWLYTQNKQCVYQSESDIDKKELENLLSVNEQYFTDTKCQQQFLERSKDIIVWQKLRVASDVDIDDFCSLYNKHMLKNIHPNFNDLYSLAISEYLISSELDISTKVERWTKVIPLANKMTMDLIAKDFKDLNEKIVDVKTKDLFLLATAFGNNIENED